MSAIWIGAARGQQNRANTQKKKVHSQRKFWLVYADSPVKILPRLLLWTLPAPSGSYQCSHVFLVQSPSAVCSLRHAGSMFFSAAAVTHVLILKRKRTLLQLDHSLYMIVRGRHYQGRDNRHIEPGLWLGKINLKSLFAFISITQISIYRRALLLDQHSVRLWELHCQAWPSRATV